MHFRLLGPLEALNDDGPVDIGTGKRAALLTYLLLNANEIVSAERLIDELWGEHPPATAAKSVQVYVSQLRKALDDGDLLVTRGNGYVMTLDDEALDINRFERLVAEAQQASEDRDPRRAADIARGALGLWRGPALYDVAYESFAQNEVARLDELRLIAIETATEAALELGDHARVVSELEPLVAENPTRERFRAQLMLALYRCGRQPEALEVYREGSRVLRDELGLEPSPELRALEQKILTHSEDLGRQRWAPRAPRARSGALRRAQGRRGAWLVAAGGAILALATAAALIERSDGSPATEHSGNTVAMLNAGSGDVSKFIPVGRTPSNVAVGEGMVWTLNADDQTITQIDPRSGRSETFSIGATPTGVAAGDGKLWVTSGEAERKTPGIGTSRVLVIDPVQHTVDAHIELPQGGIQDLARLPGQIAVGAGAVWVVNENDALARIDSRSHAVEAVRGLRTRAIALLGSSVWGISAEGTAVVEIDARAARVRRRLSLHAGRLDAIAAGGGAVWVADSVEGTLWRISARGKVTTRTIDVGQGADGVAFGEGNIWVTNSTRGTIARVDPRLQRITKTISLGDTPRAVAAGAARVWVAIAGQDRRLEPATSAYAGGPRALGGCGPVETGADGHYDRLIASDFPIQPTYAAPELASHAVLYVLRRHDFRAGRFRIGYQSCNTATPQSDQSDLKKCAANAHAYAATPAVIGVVGPYESSCAFAEIPILNAARGGAVPIVSPLSSVLGLTRADPSLPAGSLRRLYPTGVRNFARVSPTNATQAAGLVLLVRELGLTRPYLLHDDTDYGDSLAAVFRNTARARKLQLAGEARWDRDGAGFAQLARRVRAARSDGVILAGLSASSGVALVAALRARLGPKVTLIGSDAFAPTDFIFDDTHGAARGMYSIWMGLWDPHLDPAGARFKRDFQATQIGAHVGTESLYAAAATDALLAAISRSDATRASVRRALFRERTPDTPIGPVKFDRNGDVLGASLTILRIAGGDRSGRSPVPYFHGAEFVRTIRPAF